MVTQVNGISSCYLNKPSRQIPLGHPSIEGQHVGTVSTRRVTVIVWEFCLGPITKTAGTLT